MRRGDSHWVDRHARDASGAVIGIVVDVYADPLTRRPAWLAISTGFFGTRIAVAPLRGASLLGEDVVIAHDRDTVLTAPPGDVVVTIDPAEQQSLIDHYTARTPTDRSARSPSPHDRST